MYGPGNLQCDSVALLNIFITFAIFNKAMALPSFIV